MKKLFSAAASLVMAATMVGAVSPVGTSAADDKKGLTFLAYKDATLPEGVTNNGSTLSVSADAIAAGDVVIPVGMYLTENTADLTGFAADATVKSTSKDVGKVKFKKFTPGADVFFDSAKEFTAADGTKFTTDKVVAFAGTSGRTGYKAHGIYQVAEADQQLKAGTENAFVGLAWTNGGSKYTWHGEKSDTYPLVVFNVTLPKGIANGDYVIDFCNYDTEYENKSCLLEAGSKYDTDKGNLDLTTLTIKVGDAAPDTNTTTTTTTQTTATTGSGTTTTTTTGGGTVTPPSDAPDVPDGQETEGKKSHMVADSKIVFDFRNKDSEDGYWRVDPDEGDVMITPTLDTHGELITGVQFFFKVEGDFTADIDTISPALNNVSVQPNNAGKAVSLTCAVGPGSTGIPATADEPVFYIFLKPAEGLKDGLYKISVDPSGESCEVLDANKKRIDFTVIPGYIAIGDVSSKPDDSSTTTSSSTTTTSGTTTTTTTTKKADDSSTTTKAPDTTTKAPDTSGTTTTTTTKAPVTGEPLYGDTNCDKVVRINDVVLLNKWLNDNKSYPDMSEQGKLNADCYKPQGGKELTAEDSDAIIKSIVHLVTLPVEK